MSTLAQFLDDADRILVDLNDHTGANNPGGVRTRLRPGTALGELTKERSFFEPADVPGEKLVKKRHRNAVPDLRVAAFADSADDLDVFLDALQVILDHSGRLKWRRHGTTRTIYYHFEDGEIPALLRSQADAQLVTSRNLDTELPIILHRHPHGRLDRIVLDPLTVDNDPTVGAGRFVEFEVEGSAPAPIEVSLSPSAGSVQQYLVAITDNLTGRRVYQGQDAITSGAGSMGDSLGAGAADANASGGQVLACAGATDRHHKPQGRWKETVDIPKGRHLIVARLRATAAGTWFLAPHFAFYDVGDGYSPHALGETVFQVKVNGLTTFTEFTDIELGYIDIPEDAEALVLDLFARLAGSGGLHVDFVALVPADQASIVAIRPQGAVFSTGAHLQDFIGGSGNRVGTDMVMQDAGTGGYLELLPNAGHYKATIRHSIADPHTADTFALSVERLGPGGGTEATHTLSSLQAGQNERTTSFFFDATGSNHYRVQAVYNNRDAASNGTFTVHEVTIDLVPTLEADESMRTFPEEGKARKFDAAGVPKLELEPTGPLPFYVEPGPKLLYVAALDKRAQVLHPYLRSVLDRQSEVVISYAPRVF